MASTASGRGRPAIIDKSELNLGNGNQAVIRLVGDGDTVQIELPKSWSLDALQRSATRTGGRTKVTFTFDGETNGSAAPEPAVAETNGETKAPRARTAKKAAPAPEQPESSASPEPKVAAPRRSRAKKTAEPVPATV
jgi:hypothetical protein